MSYNDLRKGRFSEPGREYFITTVVQNRHRLFSDFTCARIFIQYAAKLANGKNINWLAWVLMPDHFHGLLSLTGDQPLGEVMQRLKGGSSRVLNKHLGRKGAVWQAGFYDHAIRYEEDRREMARYIVRNPVRAGLADNVLNYPHWDAVWM
jgi:REP element-mobilizing transposase RayT